MIPLLIALVGLSNAAAEDYSLPPPPAPSTATRHLDYVADHLDYAAADATIHLKGHARVVESSWTVKGEELWLDTRSRVGRSQGDLLVEDGYTAIYGDSGDFDFQNHSGTLYHASAGHGDWRVHGKSVHMDAQRRLDYYGANFTSCNVVPPHYHFHSSHMTVVPHKYLYARNAVFYWRNIPLFYTPFLYKSLSETHFLRMKVQPGYDGRNGVFLKGTLATEHTPKFSSRLYLDYYQKQGLGTGIELNRHGGTDSRGAVYGYQIKETSTGQERWALLGSGYHGVSASSMSFQGRLQAQSDANFNNDYARSNLFRVTPELINNGAVTYRMRHSNLRLSYSRDDASTGDGTQFIKQTEDYPRLDFQTQPLAVWKLPWLNTFTAFADNNYNINRPFIQQSAGTQWEATRAIPLVKGVASLTPKVDYSQTFFNRFDEAADFSSSTTYQDVFVGRYTGAPDLRVNTPVGNWDLIQTYTMRQKPDTMEDDAGAIDHGVESNVTTLQDSFRPLDRVFVRAQTGYDERVFRDHSVGFRDRVQPFVGDVVYSPRGDLDISLREDYQLDQKERSFILNSQYGNPKGTFLSGGGSYNETEPDQYFINTEFGVAPASGTWRSIHVTGALRVRVFGGDGVGALNHPQLFEKEITVTKVWHDFVWHAMVRFRPGGVREITFKIDIKFGSMDKSSAQQRDWESEWFPERTSELTGRP
jgi:LPS-assembly protein